MILKKNRTNTCVERNKREKKTQISLMHNTVKGKVTILQSTQKLQHALVETLNHAPVLTPFTHTLKLAPKPLSCWAFALSHPVTSEEM